MPSEPLQLEVSVQLVDARWKTVLRPHGKTVRSVCHAVLEASKLAKIPCRFEMAVVLADDGFIRELNHTWRGLNKPTNVLSFPSTQKLEAGCRGLLKGVESFAIGDVVLAMDTVVREAKEQGKTVHDHALHLLVHGTLHLLGYDHKSDSEAGVMESREIKILKKLDVGNPYL